MRILDARNVTVREELTIRLHAGMGYRIVLRGNVPVCDDSDETWARAARNLVVANPRDKSVAWIGGGLCIGPELFALVDCKQTVYEIEQSLEEFCPEGVKFVAGDWRDTISGNFDVIVYDLGGEVPLAELQTFLAPGGRIIP